LTWLLVASCDPVDADDPPFVEILSPVDGDTVCGAPLAVSLDVAGVTLVDPNDPPDPLPDGAAHVDVSLNGQDAVMTDSADFSIPDVVDGEFQLKVELVNADHTPLTPYAGDFLYVTVAATACP
jgi:hypothetical protein